MTDGVESPRQLARDLAVLDHIAYMAQVNQEDAEDCEMCSLIQDEPCAYHVGVSRGVGWMAEMMRAAADDPEIVADCLARRAQHQRERTA